MSSAGLGFFKKQGVVFWFEEEFVSQSDGSILRSIFASQGQLATSGDIFRCCSQGMEVLLTSGG